MYNGVAKHAKEKQAWQKPEKRQRKSSFREGEKHGDCFLCLLDEKWIEDITEKTAEKGIHEFPFEVVFFADGDGGKNAEGLTQDGKTAKGSEEGCEGQTQAEIIGGLAHKIGAVGHFQDPA